MVSKIFVIEQDIIDALTELKTQKPDLEKAVIKMNDGFSGEGNALFSYQQSPVSGNLKSWITSSIHTIRCVADDLKYDQFMEKFTSMKGGIVEEFLDGHVKTSPSVQCRINPLGKVRHNARSGAGRRIRQVFLGARFPADPAYIIEIGKMGHQIASRRKQGVLGPSD
jgi:hypothetical protein